ncbi:MAG: Asp23/Gls24 family envelope stress response protein [Actinomycetota bacterium]|nr:Asp23/Gls24 family envelope stress response protein [Actinomycetota bacterium]
MDDEIVPLGGISVSNDAVVDMVHSIISQSYGADGTSPLRWFKGFFGMLNTDFFKKGIRAKTVGSKVIIDLDLVIEEGVNPSEVASALADRIEYELDKYLSVDVGEVNIHLKDISRD